MDRHRASPPPSSPLVPALAGLVALALVVGAALGVMASFDVPRTSGFWRVTSRSADCLEEPEWMQRAPLTLASEPFVGEILASPEHAVDGVRVFHDGPRCDLFRGYLAVSERTRLTLEVHASGEVHATLDRHGLVRLDAGTVQTRRRGERIVEPGVHRIELRSLHRHGLAYVRTAWSFAPVEGAARITTRTLEEREVAPLEVGRIVPSPLEAERALERARGASTEAPSTTAVAPSFDGKSARFAAILAALALALLALTLARPRGMRSRFALDVAALATVTTALAWQMATKPTDTTWSSEVLAALRTLAWSAREGRFVDAIDPLPLSAWLVGFATHVGGAAGPRVLASTLAGARVAFGAIAAQRIAGRRAGWLVALVANGVIAGSGPVGLDPASYEAPLVALGLAGLASWVTSGHRLPATLRVRVEALRSRLEATWRGDDARARRTPARSMVVFALCAATATALLAALTPLQPAAFGPFVSVGLALALEGLVRRVRRDAA